MILVAGGMGYIGSHCVSSLLELGYEVIVFDNLSTGCVECLNEFKKIGKIEFLKGDLLNIEDLDKLFSSYKIDFVFHFAGLSQVAESIINPSKYYLNNVVGSINLFNKMIEFNVKKIVFSSTAAIYGEAQYLPIDENHLKKPINPYGKTKLIIENVLSDYDRAYELKSVCLRYFNAVGADEKLRFGECHNPETHLVPNLVKSKLTNQKFKLYGIDHNTKDGTCVRDYIDISDLISAHILAYKFLCEKNISESFNLGTKTGCSVKEIIDTFSLIINENIDYEVLEKRAGDAPSLIADNSKAKKILNWENKKDIKTSIENVYKWEKKMIEKGLNA